MPDNPSKLQNIQLTGEPSDGLAASVVKPDGCAGGAPFYRGKISVLGYWWDTQNDRSVLRYLSKPLGFEQAYRPVSPYPSPTVITLIAGILHYGGYGVTSSL